MASTEGVIIITDAEGTKTFQTLNCPHCGSPFIVIPGSGRLRHYCMECGAPTCDKAKCFEHSPFMRRVELIEAGKLPLEAL
jgi:hypothetical protein